MSDLISKGTPLKKFGRYWPTPIIQEVVIRDDHIESTIALYLNFDAATDQTVIDATILAMSDLNIYIFYVLGEEYINNILNKNNVELFNELTGMNTVAERYGVMYTGTQPWMINALDPAPAWYLIGAGAPLRDPLSPDTYSPHTIQPMADKNYVQLNFAQDFAQTGEVIYDERGDKIYKFIMTSQELSKIYIGYTTHNDGLFTPTLNPLMPGYIFSANPYASLALSDLSLFAFSSLHDYNSVDPDPASVFQTFQSTTRTMGDPTSTINWEEALIADPYRYFAAKRPATSKNLMVHQYSDVSYEHLFKDREIFLDPEIIYMDVDGAVYTAVPLQSITAQYYETDLVTHEEIVDSFKELIKETPTDDDQLKSVVDSITYALEINSAKADLLPQLDIIRKAFPDKSAVTKVGKLYERFKNRIISFNDTISKSKSLKPEIIKSPKIVDARSRPTTTTINTTYIGTAGEAEAQNYIYIYGGDNTSGNPAYISKRKVWSEPATSDSDYFIQRYGYFFFDFEKALRQTSVISAVFNIDKIQNLFGGQQTTSYFYSVSEAEVLRSHAAQPYEGLQRVGWWDPYISLTYSKDRGGFSHTMGATPIVTALTNYTNPDTGHNQSFNNSKFWTDDGTNSRYVSFLRQRNWSPAMGPDGTLVDPQRWGVQYGVPNYRLMCFEFQQCEEFDSAPFSNVEGDRPNEVGFNFVVKTTDHTWSIVEHLTSSYNAVRTGSLSQYVEYAEDLCSYNNFDGTFNSFFQKGVVDLYSNEPPEKQPWVLAPIIYETHRDLLFDEHGGDIRQIKEAGRGWAQQINPYNGNLNTLKNFQIAVDDLWNTFYAEDVGTISLKGEALGTGAIVSHFGQDTTGTGKVIYTPEPWTTEVGINTFVAQICPEDHMWDPDCVDNDPDICCKEIGTFEQLYGMSREEWEATQPLYLRDNQYVRFDFGWWFGAGGEFFDADSSTFTRKIMEKWGWCPDCATWNSSTGEWVVNSAPSVRAEHMQPHRDQILNDMITWIQARDEGSDYDNVSDWARNIVSPQYKDGDDYYQLELAVEDGVGDGESYETVYVYRYYPNPAQNE